MPGIVNGVSNWGFVSNRIRFAIFPITDLREYVAITEIGFYFINNLFLFISVDSFFRISIPRDCFSTLFRRTVSMLTCSARSI